MGTVRSLVHTDADASSTARSGVIRGCSARRGGIGTRRASGAGELIAWVLDRPKMRSRHSGQKNFFMRHKAKADSSLRRAELVLVIARRLPGAAEMPSKKHRIVALCREFLRRSRVRGHC